MSEVQSRSQRSSIAKGCHNQTGQKAFSNPSTKAFSLNINLRSCPYNRGGDESFYGETEKIIAQKWCWVQQDQSFRGASADFNPPYVLICIDCLECFDYVGHLILLL